MKISSSIGVTGGQQTTMAATFAEVVAGLGYNYTWAADFSNLAASDFTLPTSTHAFDTVSYTDKGIRIQQDNSAAGSSQQRIEITQAAFRDSAHSGPSGDFPNGMMPDIHDGDPIFAGTGPDQSGRAIGHPGRYVTIVVTFNKYDMTDSTAYQSMIIVDETNKSWFFLRGTVGPDPTIINGSAGQLTTQAEYDSIVGANPTLVTTDLNDPDIRASGNVDDNGKSVQIYAAYNKKVDYDVTYHGVIFSDVPPTLPSTPGDFLPIEISNPSIT